jgi:ABC-type Fe3+ transport system permease subunit
MDDEYEKFEDESSKDSWRYGEDEDYWGDEDYGDEEEYVYEDEDEYLERRAKSSRLLKFFILLFFVVPFVMIGVSFIFILTDFELSHKLWLSGFITFVAALISYVIYAYGARLEMAKIPTVALFSSGVIMFYLAMWFMPTSPETESRKVIGLVIITIILVIILLLVIYLLVKKAREREPPLRENIIPYRRRRPPVKVMRKKGS